MSRTAHLARLERERLLALERRGRARAEALAVSQGIAESVALLAARGAAIEAPATPRKPHRRQAGLEWLVRQGRLNDQQKRAGERYGTYYRRAQAGTAIVKPTAPSDEMSPISPGEKPRSARMTEMNGYRTPRAAPRATTRMWRAIKPGDEPRPQRGPRRPVGSGPSGRRTATAPLRAEPRSHHR